MAEIWVREFWPLARETGRVTTSYQVRFEGPPGLALQVATELAAADGVDLTSSTPPVPLDDATFALEVTVEGTLEAVTRAVDDLREQLPADGSITVDG